jgi:flagellar biosynthesis/type III secretory pathway protein FliH
MDINYELNEAYQTGWEEGYRAGYEAGQIDMENENYITYDVYYYEDENM